MSLPTPLSGGSAPSENTDSVDEMSSSEEDEDAQYAERFSDVLARVWLCEVPRFCSDLRMRMEMQHDNSHDEIYPSSLLFTEKPMFGSSYVLLVINFADGLKWLLKIPRIGSETHFDKSASASLTSEALTMSFLRAKKSIPFPNVLAFDTSIDNKLGCPFILLAYISGVPLYDIWFGESKSIPPDVRQAKRGRGSQDIALAMAQLDRFAFDSAGALIFNYDGLPIDVGPARLVVFVANLLQLSQDRKYEVDTPSYPKYYVGGSWTSHESFYFHGIDRENDAINSSFKSMNQLLRILLQLVPEPIDSRPEFVLAHPDFGIQDFTMAEDGHLKAVIDWDGVITLPRGIGYENYSDSSIREYPRYIRFYFWARDFC
ncbi:hypothetical protein K3495_g4165 [Podosphaera aphanis]|nr:hypothetical protein K3495_g4165 [Podosphaera aphanis]